ncbi:MAG: FAD binding domain-containing protein [Candidatus Acidiferrales bacterium]
MRAFLPAYEMETPRDLAATLERMASEPGEWRAFAGGTDLMVLLEAAKLPHKKFLNIWNLGELRGIAVTAEHVTLGALTTYAEVQRHEILAREFPLLCRAAAETGSVATQNRGTLGGNIANASPAADSPPALIVYGAEIELVSARGARWVPYATFHTGYKMMNLQAGELIRAIRVARPRGAAWKQYFRKVGTRRAQAISKICFAGVGRLENGRVVDVRIALGSVAPTVLRAVRAEDILRGQAPRGTVVRAAQNALDAEIAPIDDMRSTERYRRNVARNLLAEFLEVLAS